MGKNRYDSNFAGAVSIETTYTYFFARLVSIAISCFKWTGLPEEIDVSFLERTLLFKGSALFFYDDVIGAHFALPCVGFGEWDNYSIPKERTAYAMNSNRYTRTYKDSVVMFDNLLHTPTLPIVEMFAKRLTNLELTKDINLRAQKTPYLMQCTQQQRLTLENLFMKIDMFTPVIFADKNIDMNGIGVVDLKAPFIVPELQEEKINVLKEAFSFLGVGVLEIEKHERINVREVQEAQHANIAQRQCRLGAREQACEEIRKMFGGNPNVFYNEDFSLNNEDFLLNNVSRETSDGGAANG